MAFTTHLNTTKVYGHIDLINYVIGYVDSVLEEFTALTGWSFLVKFPARGNACLDNSLTNRPHLFGKTCPFHMLLKTDHEAVVFPAGTKLKPIRRKVHLRDTREHRKQATYLDLAAED